MIESKAFYPRIEQAFAGCGRARTRERFAARLGAAHGGGAPFEDDVTLLMVRRT